SDIWSLSLRSLFPYTALFRSFLPAVGERVSVSSGRPSSSATRRAIRAPLASQVKREAHARQACRTSSARQGSDSSLSARATTSRSEEHTSELQSRFELVCSLL